MNSTSTITSPRASGSMSDTYILSLSPKEYKAYLIAKSHLEMSFDVEKSIGYKQFGKGQNASSLLTSPVFVPILPPSKLVQKSDRK